MTLIPLYAGMTFIVDWISQLQRAPPFMPLMVEGSKLLESMINTLIH